MRLRIEHHDDDDCTTIEGVRYSNALFRGLGWETPPGKAFVIVKRQDGVLWLETLPAAKQPN